MKKKDKTNLLIGVVILFALIAATPLFLGTNTTGSGIQINKCTDNDGENYYTVGEVIVEYLQNDQIKTVISSDSCVNDDVEEYICSADNKIKKIIYACENGCLNGACIYSQCIDSDGGKDYFNKGLAVFYGKIDDSKMDYCLNEKLLSEYFCDGDKEIRAVEYLCTLGCKNGACL